MRYLDFGKQFRTAWNDLKKIQGYIYSSFFIFIFIAILGYVFAGHLTFLDDLLKELIDRTAGLNTWELILFILQNNLQTAFMAFVLGIFFGLFTILYASLNGLVLGYVFAKVIGEVGVLSLWRILPHGIFELPAVFIALGLGLYLGSFVFSSHNGELKKRFLEGVNVFLFIVVPLLILAAVIEGLLIAFF